MKALRDYQEAAIASLFDWLFSPEKSGQFPLMVAPVGTGKALMIAEAVKRIDQKYPRTRQLVLSHVKELLDQDAAEFRAQHPSGDYGFYCAGMNQKRLHNDITFASIQSVWNKANVFNRPPQVIHIDEAHLISHKEATQYRKFFDAVLAINPNAVFIGWTGTPYRADTGLLTEGDGAFFHGVAYEIGIQHMIDSGYLVRPITPKVKTDVDISKFRIKNHDFKISDMSEAYDKDEITEGAIDELIDHGVGRRRWFGMTVDIQHCQHFTEALKKRNINAKYVIADTPDRAEIISWFKEDTTDLRVLVNVGTLNVGFNNPFIDLIFSARSTRSPVLYTQFAGRGLRPVYAPGYDLSTKEGRLASIASGTKPDCLFMDFGKIIETLGPLDGIRITKKHVEKNPEEKAAPVMKRCPACGIQCFGAQRNCFECGYLFEFEKKVESRAERNAAILTDDLPPVEYKVIGMSVNKHHKGGDLTARATMCVTYLCFGHQFKEYICFDHPPGNYGRDRACQWHRERLPDVPTPMSVDEALELSYPMPSEITVKADGKYWRILGHKFSKEGRGKYASYEEIAF